MYIIKKITVNNDFYISSESINHTRKTISHALILLEQCIISYVKEEHGKQMSDIIKIIDISDFKQVSEPVVDTILIYRITNDPHRVHVYQRKTLIVPGTIYGHSLVPDFRKIKIFELEEYDKFDISSSQNISSIIPDIEMVSVGSTGILIPKPMTVSPIRNFIDELKQSSKFKARFVLPISSN